jgi:serine/threonine protein kinase
MNPGEALSEGHLLDGRYRVRKVLGVGGMGRVYLSNDTRLANRPVAVKEMILGDGIAEKKAIEDFTREATVLARLSHPGIPTLIDHFAENGRHYLVMEFVAGGDLDKVVQEAGGKLPEQRVLRWARQILSVLEFLHSQTPPIIYRDLKPGNIMIDKDGRAMLIDFGIARFLPKGGKATMIGSPGYAPPEQYVGRVEARSDLYSLAATMHHLLTGRDPVLEPPFSFPPVRTVAPEISIATASAVDRALSHEMDKRFASAHDMLQALPEAAPEARIGGTGARGQSGSFGQSGAMGTMSTIVLNRPAASAAGAAPRAQPPTPPRLRPAPGAPSSITNMPTVVLSRPASPAPAPSAGGSKPLSPPVKRAIELGVKARALIERGLKSKLVASVIQPEAAQPQVSSTAKTKDLKRPGAGAPRPARPASTGDAPPARTASRTGSGAQPRPRTPAVSTPPLFADTREQKAAGPTARLVARGENIEYVLKFARTVLGRSQDPRDVPDIDLAALARGTERVSRRHAEIIRRGADFFIRDLGSMNGTFIAGQGRLGRDQLYKLKDRDQVILGGAILQFRRG